MIICLQTRQGQIHIISWTSNYVDRHTICGQIFTKKDRVNVFGTDNTVLGMCPNCAQVIDTWYQGNLNRSPSLARSRLLSNSRIKYTDIVEGFGKTDDLYQNSLDSRYWRKLTKYKKKIR